MHRNGRYQAYLALLRGFLDLLNLLLGIAFDLGKHLAVGIDHLLMAD